MYGPLATNRVGPEVIGDPEGGEGSFCAMHWLIRLTEVMGITLRLLDISTHRRGGGRCAVQATSFENCILGTSLTVI